MLRYCIYVLNVDSAEILSHVIFSPESAAGSSEAGSYRSPFCSSSRRGADRRWGFSELAYHRAAGDGQAFPTRERHRVLD